MTRYIAKRLAQLVLVVWIVVSLLFLFVRLSGDPALIIAGPTATPEVLEQTRERLGLDTSLPAQYLTFLGDVVTLDFGRSYTTGEQALPLLMEALPNSLMIAIPALVLSMVLAIVVGTYAALRNGSRSGRAVVLTAWMGDAIPFFVLAYVFILVFSVRMSVLPPGGNEQWTSKILPITAIVIPQVSTLSRLVRGQLLDVLEQPYVVAARSTGMAPWRVLAQAVPNAIPPVLSFMGVMAAFFLTILVVVEPIFNYPGFGGLLIRGVTGRDFPIVQAAVFILAITIIGANILTDVVNRLIDPRLRREAA